MVGFPRLELHLVEISRFALFSSLSLRFRCGAARGFRLVIRTPAPATTSLPYTPSNQEKSTKKKSESNESDNTVNDNKDRGDWSALVVVRWGI